MKEKEGGCFTLLFCSEMKKKILSTIVFIIIVSCAVGIGLYFKMKNQWREISLEKGSVTFSIPKKFLEMNDEETNNEERVRTLFRAKNDSRDIPLFFHVRIETGLKIATSLTRQELLRLILTNAEKAFPLRFSGFQKISEDLSFDTQPEMAEMIFTYEGPSGELSRQRFVVLKKDENIVYYFAFNAKNEDFEKVNRKYFSKIIKSVNIQ